MQTQSSTAWIPANVGHALIWRRPDQDTYYSHHASSLSNAAMQGSAIIQGLFPGYAPTLALIDPSCYRESLALRHDIPDWVKVCVRNRRVCYSIDIAESWGKGRLEELPVEDRRELIHELMHKVYPFSSVVAHVPSHLMEGVAEMVPRMVLGYQLSMPASIDYLLNTLPDELIDVHEIDQNGEFHYSQDRLSFNKAYMSEFAYTVGLLMQLKGDLLNGINYLRECARQTDSMREFNRITRGAVKMTTHDLQLEGINHIREYLATCNTSRGSRAYLTML